MLGTKTGFKARSQFLPKLGESHMWMSSYDVNDVIPALKKHWIPALNPAIFPPDCKAEWNGSAVS